MDIFRLPKSIRSEDSLNILSRVPRRVKDDNAVGADKVCSQSSSLYASVILDKIQFQIRTLTDMRNTYGGCSGIEKRRIINLRSDAFVKPSSRKKSSSRRHLRGQTSGILRVSASSIMSKVPILWVKTKTFSFFERASLIISKRTHSFPLNSSKLSLAICLSITPCHQSASSCGISSAGSSASLNRQ